MSLYAKIGIGYVVFVVLVLVLGCASTRRPS